MDAIRCAGRLALVVGGYSFPLAGEDVPFILDLKDLRASKFGELVILSTPPEAQVFELGVIAEGDTLALMERMAARAEESGAWFPVFDGLRQLEFAV